LRNSSQKNGKNLKKLGTSPETTRYFKNTEYLEVEIRELETYNNSKNITDLCRRINEY
jgi:hypothetical protein